MRDFARFAAWPAIAGLLAALLILNGWIWPGSGTAHRPAPQSGFRSAVAAATPSVVNIYTAKRVVTRQPPLLNNRYFLMPRGIPRERIERSLGSGVIMNDGGYILTNNHVIPEDAAIQVSLSDGRDATAEVIGRDPQTDLAALRIDLPELTAIRIADSEQLAVGDIVLAIGNPLGLSHTVTQGIVSGLGRFGFQPSTYEGFIQTDAVIHPGNSGGALVDTSGALVGINSVIYTSAGNNGAANVGIGISLAIPSRLAQFVMDDLIRYGRVIRGWLGVSAGQVIIGGSPNLRVDAVTPGGPADRAGLRAGDTITHIGNEPISDLRLTMYEVALMRPGERLDITVSRDGESLELQAIVGSEPDH